MIVKRIVFMLLHSLLFSIMIRLGVFAAILYGLYQLMGNYSFTAKYQEAIKVKVLELFTDLDDIDLSAADFSSSIFSTNSQTINSLIGDRKDVAKIELRKILPSTLQVTISGRQPIAISKEGKKNVYIDKEGVEFQSNRVYDAETLIEVERTSDLVPLSKLAMQLSDIDFKAIKSASYIDNRRWNVMTKEGVLVKLPKNISDHNISGLNELIDSSLQIAQLQGKKIKSMDLRFFPKKIFMEMV